MWVIIGFLIAFFAEWRQLKHHEIKWRYSFLGAIGFLMMIIPIMILCLQ